MGTAMVNSAGGTVSRSRLAEMLSPQELADVLGTIDSAKRLLSPDAMTTLEDIHDFDAATSALNLAWTAVSRALNGDEEAIQAVASSEDLIQLLIRIHGAESIVRRIEVTQQKDTIRTVRQALGQFQNMGQMSQLSDRCPEVMAEMGFDRAMVSMVDRSVWTPTSAYVDRDPTWAEAIVQSGQDQPQHLVSSLPEFELVRRGNGILVTNAQRNPTVNKAIVEPSLSRSYVAAALRPEGKVVGFLHCDQYFHRGDVCESDRDLLTLFAQGFSYVLERAILYNRAAAIQAEVARLTGSINAAVEGFVDNAAMPYFGPLFGGLQTVNTVPAIHPALDTYDLTRREIDVLRLIAAGKSNCQISDHLVISAGTVKSHVKHIFRKLGVTSRAEAVSSWYNSQSR